MLTSLSLPLLVLLTVVTFAAASNVVVIPGNLPLIITAPHGGGDKPASLPDRVSGCWTGSVCLWLHVCPQGSTRSDSQCGISTHKDTETQEVAQKLASSWGGGRRPHLVMLNIARSKVDANREKYGEGTLNNTLAEAVWEEYHSGIATARQSVLANFGKGLMLDVHRQAHPEGWLELGYRVSKTSLAKTDAQIDSTNWIKEQASIHALAARQGSLSSLIRGPRSLGGLLSTAGIGGVGTVNYTVVPSPSVPSPGSGNYFIGGFSVNRYGSSWNQGNLDAIMMEMPQNQYLPAGGVMKMAEPLALALEIFFQEQYGIQLNSTLISSTGSNGGGGGSGATASSSGSGTTGGNGSNGNSGASGNGNTAGTTGSNGGGTASSGGNGNSGSSGGNANGGGSSSSSSSSTAINGGGGGGGGNSSSAGFNCPCVSWHWTLLLAMIAVALFS